MQTSQAGTAEKRAREQQKIHCYAPKFRVGSSITLPNPKAVLGLVKCEEGEEKEELGREAHACIPHAKKKTEIKYHLLLYPLFFWCCKFIAYNIEGRRYVYLDNFSPVVRGFCFILFKLALPCICKIFYNTFHASVELRASI